MKKVRRSEVWRKKTERRQHRACQTGSWTQGEPSAHSSLDCILLPNFMHGPSFWILKRLWLVDKIYHIYTHRTQHSINWWTLFSLRAQVLCSAMGYTGLEIQVFCQGCGQRSVRVKGSYGVNNMAICPLKQMSSLPMRLENSKKILIWNTLAM